MVMDPAVIDRSQITAVVLAGGRSSRLGTADKAELRVGELTLLELTVSAALSVASACVVVGPRQDSPTAGTMPDGVLTTREHPEFSGPAAAIAAGVARLAESANARDSGATLILACDMPGIAGHLPALVAALGSAPRSVEGVSSVDSAGRDQPLASLIRTPALASAIERLGESALIGASVRHLFSPLALVSITARDGATDDVDTWEDAARLGARATVSLTSQGES